MNDDSQSPVCGGPRRPAREPTRRRRRGFVLVLLVVLLAAGLLVLIAMAMDWAYVMAVRGEAQTSADAAALAGAWALIDPDRIAPQPDATQAIANARTAAVEYAAKNEVGVGENHQRLLPVVDRNDANAIDGEVVIGHLPTWSYPPIYPWDTGTLGYVWQFNNPLRYNAVCVRVQRTEARNGPVQLYFGRLFGWPTMNVHVAATAIIEWGKPVGFRPTDESGPTSLLPFTVLKSGREIDGEYYYGYDDALDGATGMDNYAYDDSTAPPGPGRVSPGPDGVFEFDLYPVGATAGNFGTIDLGGNDNSEAVLERQILQGVNAEDLAQWGGEFSLADGPEDLQGDTGISAGMKDELASIIGEPRTVLLYQTVVNPGNNAMFTVVECVGIVILDVNLTGMPKIMTVQPCPVADDSVIIGDPPPDEDWFPSVVRPPRLIH